MSFRLRVLIILLCVLILYAGLDYGIQRLVVYPSFISLERREAEKEIERCVAALRRELHHLDGLCHDWAAWNDTYEFVEDRNADYISGNLLDESYQNNQINLLAICKPDGEVIWSRAVDTVSRKPLAIDRFPSDSLGPDHPLLAFRPDMDSWPSVTVTGVLLTDHGPMLVSSRPILRSNHTGPVRGAMIMARFIDRTVAQTLSQQTRSDLKIWPIGGPGLPEEERRVPWKITRVAPIFIEEQDRNTLKVYAVFPGIGVERALLMRVDVQRMISAEGLIASRYTQLSIILAGGVVLAVMYLLLQKTLISPLSRFTTHVKAIGQSDNLSGRLFSCRTDEIGALAREFDRMLDGVEKREKALRESEQRWRSLVENAPNIIMIVDRDGAIQFINRNLPGLNIEQMLGTRITDYVNQEHHEKVKKALAHVFETGQASNYETVSGHADGATYWYVDHIGPITHQGKVVAATLVSSDITERKRAEEALRNSEEWFRCIFDDSRDAVFIVDADAKLVDVNEACVQLTGYSKTELKKMSTADLHDPDDFGHHERHFSRIMAGQPVTLSARIRRKDGSKVTVEFSCKRTVMRDVPYMHATAREVNPGQA